MDYFKFWVKIEELLNTDPKAQVIRGMGTLSSLLKVLNERRKASTVNGRFILQDE